MEEQIEVKRNKTRYMHIFNLIYLCTSYPFSSVFFISILQFLHHFSFILLFLKNIFPSSGLIQFFLFLYFSFSFSHFIACFQISRLLFYTLICNFFLSSSSYLFLFFFSLILLSISFLYFMFSFFPCCFFLFLSFFYLCLSVFLFTTITVLMSTMK